MSRKILAHPRRSEGQILCNEGAIGCYEGRLFVLPQARQGPVYWEYWFSASNSNNAFCFVVDLASASGPVREHYALLRAFACERAGRPLAAEETHRVVAACVTPAHPRPFPLEKWWGELAAFVDRHA